MRFYMPVKMLSGQNAVKANKEEFNIGKKCLIVTGKNSAKACGALDDVIGVLNELNIDYSVYSDICQNPTVESCIEAGRIGKDADFIIGIGGGSPLDAAKAVAVVAANPELDEDGLYSCNWVNKPLPCVLIGTTSGTGSEVTCVSVLTDSKQRKHSLNTPKIYASVAIGDAKYTESLSEKFTVSTAVDALAHCVESYFSKKADDISRAASIHGIKMILPNLTDALDGKKLSSIQREELYNASILGGIAISVTGTCFPHNVGYCLTEQYKVPHGLACAEFMPDLFDHVRNIAPEYTEKFFNEIGYSEEYVKSIVSRCSAYVDVSMTKEHIQSLLPRWENAGTVKNTIGTVTKEDIGKILIKKYTK